MSRSAENCGRGRRAHPLPGRNHLHRDARGEARAALTDPEVDLAQAEKEVARQCRVFRVIVPAGRPGRGPRRPRGRRPCAVAGWAPETRAERGSHGAGGGRSARRGAMPGAHERSLQVLEARGLRGAAAVRPRPSPSLPPGPSPPLPPCPSPPPAPAPRSSARGTGPPAPSALPWRSSARGAGWGAGRGAGLEGGGGIPPAPRSSLTRRSGASRCPRAVLRMERTRTLPRTLAPCPPERSWGGRTWVSPSTRSRSPASRRSPPAELGRTEPNRMRGNGVTG
jgi:hypothetical protein